jgi:hypothetical protein
MNEQTTNCVSTIVLLFLSPVDSQNIYGVTYEWWAVHERKGLASFGIQRNHRTTSGLLGWSKCRGRCRKEGDKSGGFHHGRHLY